MLKWQKPTPKKVAIPAWYANAFYKRNKTRGYGKSRDALRRMGGVWCAPLEVAKNFVVKLGEMIFGLSKDKIRAGAEEYKKLLLATLESQRYAAEWTPLSERYLAWKIKNKRDPRILISTKEYMQAIEIREEKQEGSKGKSRIVYVVGLPDRIHQDSGLPFRKLARIHEFGTKRIPARPLWRPTQEEFKAKHAKKVLERIKFDISTEIKDLIDQFRRTQTDYSRVLRP